MELIFSGIVAAGFIRPSIPYFIPSASIRVVPSNGTLLYRKEAHNRAPDKNHW